ncbi:HPr kinase/phosphorylase [Chlamydia trachomatis]|nr:HPr kinase/phosphorylase [Chlamydia trachomatis]
MRGVGVINVERMFGIGSFASRAEIALHIVLEAFDDSKAYDRIGIEQKEYSEICGIRILKIRIPVSSGRPMATIIETAVTNYLLIQNGIDSAKEFEDRVIQAIYVNKSEEDEEEENAATTK